MPNRFFRRGLSKVHFLPAVASLGAPTRAEITAGVDLTPFIAGINGFSIQNDPITTPDLESAFDKQIDGPDKADSSGFDLYDDKVSTTVRTALEKGTDGFIVLMSYGDVAAKRCEVWPVRTTGFNDDWSLDAKAAQAMARFAVTDVPRQDAVIPALT